MAITTRQQTRLDYLQKNRPNDPQIAKLKPLMIPQSPVPGATTPTGGLDPRQQTRLNFLLKNRPNDPQVKKLQGMAGAAPAAPAPVAPTTPAAPIAPIDFGNTAGAAPAPAATDAAGNANTLFPNTRMFEPENYEGSPLYKFQVQQGQQQLARSLAKKGLAKSGAAIEAELNIPLRAAAQDTDRMTRIASENADRLYNMQNNESNRLTNAGNEQWNRAFSIAQLMAAQSPWNAAIGGLNATADLTTAQGQAQANFLKDAYQRIIASGGGGGGGGGAGFTPTPVPSGGPDYTNIMPTQIGGNYSSNSGWLNLLNQGLSSIF